MHWAEKEVASVDLCKRLKELGFPQTPDGYYWVKYAPDIKYKLYFRTKKDFFYFHNGQLWTILADPIEVIKAYTYRELSEWLPSYWISWRDKKGRYWISRIREFKCVFNSEKYPELPRPIAVALENFIKREYTPTDNEADARAKLLIFLRENGYITFNQGDKDAQPRQQT